MNTMNEFRSSISGLGKFSLTAAYTLLIVLLALSGHAFARDLDEIKERGVLRHLGIPYANFVTGSGDGMDVELVQLFAQRLGLRYEYVKTDWTDVVSDLTGKRIKVHGNDVEVVGETAIKGDIIANGMTIIPWREKILDFGLATFPTQVWLVSRADTPIQPILPSGDINKDIKIVKSLLHDHSLLGKANTCLEPALYGIQATDAKITLFPGGLNELAPAVLNGESELTLLDVPDALVALQKWPGQIKVIGPISERQSMAPGFRKDSPKLRMAFNEFLQQMKKDGTFSRLVDKYYPFVFDYYADFFNSSGH